MMLKLVVVEVVVFLATLAPSTHSSTHYGARGRAQIARERAQIARQWAPLVWLHPEEEFYPDSVPAFLAHITPSIKVDGDGVEVDEGVATFIVPPLPMGGGSHESFLNVNHNFECGVCSLPRFLHGRQPDEHYVPPVYTVIHSCDPPPYRSRDGELEVERSSEDSEYPMFEDAQRIPKELQPGSEEDYEYLQAEDTFPASSEIQQPSSEGESEDRFHMSRELWPGKEDYSEYEDLEPGNETNQHRATRTPLRTPAEQHTFTVTYWMFYPYNRGKPVCSVNLGYFLGRLFKPRDKRGGCHGEEVIMGDHVGEWEHVSIQFKGSTPTQMYVSTHTFGAYYTYDHQQGHFVYSDEDVREGLPLPIPPQYPRTVHLVGTRPVLYSSKGSHGLWAAAGVHHYSWIPLLLDETGKGTPWKTWKNMHIIDLKEPETLTHHRSWWGYEGRWGNPSERCHLLMGTQCEMNQGPTGIPRKRIIFPCSHPNP
ncbi:hypothetical protein Pmani_029572 [Petrolisthes manimaculis]|uniref:Uncharacterized protein n=1 Tax=Petrolisthes manimaculis TaxID=1843537 RepID=A0AAE1TWU6_9EUCA|nr:hypothetical protein Pmani_029572 [Petrolisthes manimaculis]